MASTQQICDRMQPLQAPFSPTSSRHSSKVNYLQPSSSHWRSYDVSGPCQPMTGPTGVGPPAHLDVLLFNCAQAAVSAQDLFHEVDSFNTNHTIVLHSAHPHSFLPIHLEEEEDNSFQGGRLPERLRKAPVSDSTNPRESKPESPQSVTPTRKSRRDPRQQPFTSTRSLTCSFDVDFDIMAAVQSAPGTPPDLSESRSSKSSSINSQFSAQDEVLTEISNFEEIGLDDDHNTDLKLSSTTTAAQRKLSVQDSIVQAPYYTRRPTLPDIKPSKQRGSDGPRSATGSLLKRGFTSPSLASFDSQLSRQRSNSPPNRLARSASNVSFGNNSISPRSSIAPASRRGSWQPRKTIKEIEAEYHDSDDDLPDDASLWNVPISPFPASNNNNNNNNNSHSALSSARGSPERGPSLSPQPLPLEHVKSAPDRAPRRMSSAQHLSQRHRVQPRSSSYSLSKSNPTSPNVPNTPWNNRTKSWTHAMSDLSNEARVISQNLVVHAESLNKEEKERIFNNVPQRSSAPGAIQLPPIQRGPLDFMPISKEKEAILSRTRPSWLPPKDPKEEARHLKEYQKMMAASLQAEKKRESKVKPTQLQKDDIQARLGRIWDYYVEPSTDIVNIDTRVNDLCWRGISPRVRGKVWQRRIGNSLGLTAKTYSRALDRARVIKSKGESDLSQHEKSMMVSFNDIERDAETAFPELGLFQRNGPMWSDLIKLCEAHACYRGDIGYLYGVQLIGALLLLQISDPADAFIILENALNNPLPMAFQAADVIVTQKTYNKVVSTLGMKYPRLHDYLFEPSENGGLGLRGEEILEPMFRTMFSNGLDIDRLCRVWDLWMFQGDRILIRTAVAILGSLQTQIFKVSGDFHLKRRNVQEMLGWGPFNRTEKGSYWRLDGLGDEDAFVEIIRTAGQLDYNSARP